MLNRVDRTPAGRYAHPEWLVAALDGAWPELASDILAANNVHPPMVLRVDLTKNSATEYLQRLLKAGLPGRAMDWAPSAIVLERPVAVALLPGFQAGLVSDVQAAGGYIQ